MIELMLKHYCDKCMYFEPKVERFPRKDGCRTLISCELADQCESIEKHLKRSILEDKAKYEQKYKDEEESANEEDG